MAAHHSSDDKPISFKETLNLPRTDFPMRAESQKNDPLLLQKWRAENLFQQAMKKNEGNPTYILHDGPPYANGHIHLGHAYNKILKDIITKSYRMAGFHVPVRPGWDCHGLPIEIKVSSENPGLDRNALTAACRSYARKWVDTQRQEFENLGVLMDWANPYLTMDFSYESVIMRSFGKLVEKGFIERKNKTVPWCLSCKTVLASAEIEYKDRKDPSLYVLFKATIPAKQLGVELSEPFYFVIWTTTPWTLPLNRAVLYNKSAEYHLIRCNDKLLLVGAAQSKKIAEMLNVVCDHIATVSAAMLEGMQAQHPFIENLVVPLIADESVGISEGTAFVHCAPGCGPLDYEIGVKNGLEIYAPVSAAGTYTTGILPEVLEGMSVIDGQIWVIKKLAELGSLLHKSSITHSYPHCWRCHNGLIFRATRQWFFDLQHESVKERTSKSLQEISFSPETGKNFLKATIENRWEWCLSRQRVWGVPIPALLCNNCDAAYTTPDFIYSVAQGVAREGVEYWHRVSLKDLGVDKLNCPHCNATDFRKEQDILDVWFDAGLSHQAVLLHGDQKFPANLYLEGIDQHRGWFQSSLLTSIALMDKPCTTGIMTHGFTVDGNGQKMSKSLGNVVAPQEIIARLGTDGLRLWVASIGHDGDAVVSEILLNNVAEVFRKIRNTCRGLLMNLYDFDIQKHQVNLDDLKEIDRYMIHQTARLNYELIERYHQGDFSAVIHKLTDFCAVELSSLYLDIIKDRLYCEAADSSLRRSAQTALWYILDTITRLMAPVMSFTAETIFDYYKNNQGSIHLEQFARLKDPYAFDKGTLHAYEHEFPETVVGESFVASRHMQEEDMLHGRELSWVMIRELRSAVLKAIEPLRAQGLIKQSMEASVSVYIDPSSVHYGTFQTFIENLQQKKESIEDFFKEFFVVSRVYLVDSPEGLQRTSLEGCMVGVAQAQGYKCPRCWQWDETEHPEHLCKRCQKVLQH